MPSRVSATSRSQVYSAQDNTWADVPVIFGTNLNEGTIFVPALVLVVPGTPFPPTPAAMQKGA